MVLVQERCEIIYVPPSERFNQGVDEFELRGICRFWARHLDKGSKVQACQIPAGFYIPHQCVARYHLRLVRAGAHLNDVQLDTKFGTLLVFRAVFPLADKYPREGTTAGCHKVGQSRDAHCLLPCLGCRWWALDPFDYYSTKGTPLPDARSGENTLGKRISACGCFVGASCF